MDHTKFKGINFVKNAEEMQLMKKIVDSGVHDASRLEET